MNKDDIIRLAREALLPSCHLTHPKALERFAALVAAAEREECAKVCEEERERLFWGHNVQAISADKLAEAIRARGEK
jgi:hypothetical protein